MADESLFSDKVLITDFDCLLTSLQSYLKYLEIALELPSDSLFIRPNASRKGDKVVSWSFCIHEPYYPAPYGDDKFDNQVEQVFTFFQKLLKSSGVFCVLYVKQSILEKVGVVGFPVISVIAKSETNKVSYSITDDSLFPFMRNLILYGIRSYHSNEDPFGCCSRYVQCSDAKKCVHPNKLFSTACMYRHHLERGHIFYGKNKNIS